MIFNPQSCLGVAYFIVDNRVRCYISYKVQEKESMMIKNEVFQAIRNRRSAIRFTSEPVSDEQIETILEAGRWAPSYLNAQPWLFIVVKDSSIRKEVGELVKRATIAWQGFLEAPVAIAVATNPEDDPKHFVEAGAVAAQNMALMAHSLGLSSYWIGVYDIDHARKSAEADLKKLLKIPVNQRLISILPIGVAETVSKKNRKDLSELVFTDTYQE